LSDGWKKYIEMFSSFTENFKCFYLSRRDFADSYTKFTFVNVFAPGNVIRKSVCTC